MYYRLCIIFMLLFTQISCQGISEPRDATVDTSSFQEAEIEPGAWQVHDYLPLLTGKKVAMVVNHTSVIGAKHTVDSLRNLGVNIQRIFSPEHGFRGNADAGAHIADEKDPDTGIPIVSLYGDKRQPAKEDLEEIDVLVFDIQDVGARFYTYISTLHYVMEACAAYQRPLIVLDRPNPNGHYVDGPIREAAFKSFVGMHEVPVVYGMTIGEYAQMINGEGWLEDERSCQLQVIHCKNYRHDRMYELPVPPSPNLPNLRSILLYPSLCFFEGTPLSIGRGTQTQFQVIGHPAIEEGTHRFTPKPMFGAAKPKLQDEVCVGIDLTNLPEASIFAEGQLNLQYLLSFHKNFPDKSNFFNKNGWFDKLAGTESLREQIASGVSEVEIRSSWKEDIATFMTKRAKYLIYP